MIDIVGIIAAAAPIVVGLATVVFNFVLYLKHKNISVNQPSLQQNNPEKQP